MSESEKILDAMAAPEAAVFHPILSDAGTGRTFAMLGTTMRLIAPAAATGGQYTMLEQVTPPGWGPPRHIHSRETKLFTFWRAPTICMSATSVGPFPPAPPLSCPATFRTAFATLGRRRAVCSVLLLRADLRNISWPWRNPHRHPVPHNWRNWPDHSV
jgi:hypothetical protein